MKLFKVFSILQLLAAMIVVGLWFKGHPIAWTGAFAGIWLMLSALQTAAFIIHSLNSQKAREHELINAFTENSFHADRPADSGGPANRAHF